jgi:hypothetical protein
MAARIANWMAIAIGGAGGILAALSGGAANAPAVPTQNLPLRPIGEIAARVQAAAPAPTAAPAAMTLRTPPTTSSAEAPLSTATTRAGLAESASASATPANSAEIAPLPRTPQSLLHAEMHCDQGKSESCIIAARSYEAGSAGATDPEKAQKYRKIALTMWISHCDRNSAAACLTLAKMYRAGAGVPQSDRNADALIERARDLCHYNDVPSCRELPNR